METSVDIEALNQQIYIDSEFVDKIKEETKATIRLIPIDQDVEEGKCIYSGNPSQGRVAFAVAY